MSKRLAAIDLGTNTFHLLIVEETKDQGFRQIHRERIYVSLAEESIDKICKAAFIRGINALKHFNHKLYTYKVKQFRAIGTAALRTASNGLEFIAAAKNETGISIELVDGAQEAELIYQGVRAVVPFPHPSLIMDIGGGSVELILADKHGLIDAKSFPIGITVLFNNFIFSDPVTPEQIQNIQKFLHLYTDTFFQKNNSILPIKSLIGAAGTFEVLNQMLGNKTQNTIEVASFQQLYLATKDTTHQQRLNLPNIPKSRAQMIVGALILTDFICRQARIQEILISSYSLKEGAILEMIKN